MNSIIKTPKNTARLLFLLALMSGIGAFPIDVILPSTPEISKQFGLSVSETTTGIAVFVIVFAITQIFIGRASDHLGRKRIFIFCVLLASVGSLICTMAKNSEEFYLARTLQAIGCGGFVLSQAFVQDFFAPTQRAKSRIMLTSVSGVCISLSPMLGVFLQNSYGWRASFYTFTVLCALIILMAAWSLPNDSYKNRTHLKHLDKSDSNPSTYFYGTLIATIAFASHFSFIILSPVIFLELLALDIIQYGKIMVTYGAAYVIGGLLANYIIGRISAWNQMVYGLILLATAGLIMLVIHSLYGVNELSVIICVIISTCGVSIVRPAATNIAMDAMPAHAGTAAAGINTMVFLGGGFISFLLGIFSNHAFWLLPSALLTMATAGLLLCFHALIYTSSRSTI